ncbi:MAG: 4-hydroxybenzoate 3-monooxygenase [Candidatus Eremiobacteraeota bacterium]|nr:4-hydroxybenzoate 3-monooxygenase [Candidatus Eremiobacteraeota bacterium]
MAELRGTRTQVGIIGAGPAGLVLALLLRRHGIESIVLEARSREYCEQRIRAGVLEHGTVELLDANGVGARMRREGLVHGGIYLRFGGRSRHIDFPALTGKTITVYGQHEVVKDLIAAHLASNAPLHFDVSDVAIEDIETDRPSIRYRDAGGTQQTLACDVVAGCDGFHGIARDTIPPGVLTAYERVYPFAWLGILSESRAVAHELIYTHHARGFALFSQRSPMIQRMYLQCEPDEDLAQWPGERIWDELHRRLEGDDAPTLVEGAILQKGVTAMRSFVVEPMQYRRLFLAGDAAHIVPPTGAKGMNLAIADVAVLADALAAFYGGAGTTALDSYSARCLRRVWRAQRFSAWMTSMLHRAPAADAFAERLQLAELDYVTSSHAASQSLAENYVGQPFDANVGDDGFEPPTISV